LNFARDVVDSLADEARVGLVFVDEFGHRRDYSFAEVRDQSQRYAAVLRAFGVASGERVAMRASNTAKCIFTMLALDRLGAVCVPCMEAWSDEQVFETIVGCDASTVIANRKYRSRIDDLRERLPATLRYIVVGEEQEGWARLDALTARANPFAGVSAQDTDPAFIIGSISYSGRALYEAGRDACARLELARTDRFWCTFAMGGTAWVVHTLAAAWSCGAAMTVHEGSFEPRERLELARELDVTVLLQTVAEYEAQAALDGLDRLRLPRLRKCLCAGEPSDPQALQRWEAALGRRIERAPNGAPSLQKA
jgi:acetyl-CoA synthetase